MTHEERLRELLLHYEDLSDDARAHADALLDAHPEYRAVLARLREAERARPLGALRDEATVDALDPVSSAEADRSLDALKRRVARQLAGTGAGDARARNRSRFGRWLPAQVGAFALAGAVAVLLLLWGRPPSPFRDVALTVPAGTRAGSIASVRETWQTGDAFALSLSMARSARIVVLHVDPDGIVQILSPDPFVVPLDEVEVGSEVILPNPGSGVVWRFEGRSGPESFVVVATPSEAPPLREVLDAFPGVAADREARLRRLLDRLEALVGPTRRLDVRHEP